MSERGTIEKSRTRPIEVILSPLQRFLRLQAAGGVLLLVCTVLALAWANSPFAGSYQSLWHIQCTIGFGTFQLSKPLLLWVNDGLMAVFFLTVGLEIKREILVGELSSLRQATLPIAAALGGMVVPAALYTALNWGSTGANGWGIPMATDIAFALGVLALMGSKVPVGLKVFLAALAIADDLGAVLVIAIFYTDDISAMSLGVGGLVLGVLMLSNMLGIRHPAVYAILGFFLWVAFLKSGVHATIAGVLLAGTIPVRTVLNCREYVNNSRRLLDEFERAGGAVDEKIPNERQFSIIQSLEAASELAQAPLQRLEHALHPWVAFFIMPVFAVANAGVVLDSTALASFREPVTLGVILGLVIGKPLGIVAASWMAVRLGAAALPTSVSWKQLHATGWLAGIGFTMSLFIAGLAFGESAQLEQAKIGIIAASTVAGLSGLFLLRRATAS